MRDFMLCKNSLYVVKASPRCFGLYLLTQDTNFTYENNKYRAPEYYNLNNDWIEDYESFEQIQLDWSNNFDSEYAIETVLTWNFLFNSNDVTFI